MFFLSRDQVNQILNNQARKHPIFALMQDQISSQLLRQLFKTHKLLGILIQSSFISHVVLEILRPTQMRIAQDIKRFTHFYEIKKLEITNELGIAILMLWCQVSRCVVMCKVSSDFHVLDFLKMCKNLDISWRLVCKKTHCQTCRPTKLTEFQKGPQGNMAADSCGM